VRKSNIFKPRLSVSDASEELIYFIAYRLDEFLSQKSHNAPMSEVIFSPRESTHLEECANRVLEDRNLFYSLYFVEKLFSDTAVSEEELREIYLTQRKRFGYDRALSSARWHEYVTRLGMRKGSLSTYLRGAEQMTFEHFIRMERRLLEIFNTPPQVTSFALEMIHENQEVIEQLRRTPFDNRSKKTSFTFVDKVKSSLISIREKNSMPPEKLSALMVVVTNSTSLFSSRDWSVAGTISTMAGGIAMAIYRE